MRSRGRSDSPQCDFDRLAKKPALALGSAMYAAAFKEWRVRARESWRDMKESEEIGGI